MPPEDVVVISGYERYPEALADSRHNEHEDMLRRRDRLIRISF